jgi:hypothetical protein
MKHRYNYEYLQQFCNDNAIELEYDYSKELVNRDTIICGKCKGDGCCNLFEKNFRCLTKIQNFGCNICAKEIRKERVIKTCEQKYGVSHALQVKPFREKGKNTNLEKYGVEFSLQSVDIRNKGNDTKNIKYGNKNFNNREKYITTNIAKFGVKNPSQNDEIKQLKINTCLKKYGVENPSQNSKILEKAFKSSCRLKNYILPSGNTIKIQGYEHYALDELLQIENIDENDILNGCSNVPEIWYNGLDNRRHRYFVDIFIPHQNRCIEVKSDYTITRDTETIKIKQ